MNVGDCKDLSGSCLNNIDPYAPRYLNGCDSAVDGRLLKRGYVSFGTQLGDSIKAAVNEFQNDPDAQRRGIGVASFGTKRRDIHIFYHQCPLDGVLHFWIPPLPRTDEQVIDNLRKLSNSNARNLSAEFKKMLDMAASRIEQNHVATRETVERLEEELRDQRCKTEASRRQAAAIRNVSRSHELSAARNAAESTKFKYLYYGLRHDIDTARVSRLLKRNLGADCGMGEAKQQNILDGN